MKKNVASQIVSAVLIATADGSAVTAGTTTVQVTIDGGTQTLGTGTVTHEGNGLWSYAPTQAETNGDHISFLFINSSAITTNIQVYTTFPQTGDAFAGQSSINGNIATVNAIVTGIDTVVDAILVDTGTTIPAQITALNNISAADVRTELSTELGRIDVAISTRLASASYTAPDNASIAAILVDTNELQTDDVPGLIGALENISAAQVNAQVDAALADYDAPTKTEMDAAFTEIKGATWSSTTDTLEAIRDRGDAAWTTGGGGSAPTVEEIRAEMDSNSTQLAAIVADTNELQTDDVPGLIAALNNLSSADVTAAVPTTAEIEAALLNEGDGQALIDAIVVAIGNSNVDEVALVAAIRADLERVGGALDNIPTNTEMTAAFTEIKGATWASGTDTLEAIRDRGDAAWTTGAGGSSPTAADIRAEIDANSTQLAAIVQDTGTTIPAQITALNDFDPATDTVARVTLVDTTTVNTDMRGTDNAMLAASYTAPDNASIAAILVDTGTTLPAQVTAAVGVIQTDIGNLNNIAASDVWVVPTREVTGGTIDTNNDMRGTEGALTAVGYTPPDNASIAAILTDTGTTIPAQISALNNISAADVRIEIDANSTQLTTILNSAKLAAALSA